MPFCESLCTFCGCHKRITKQHGVEQPYVETVLKEWDLYRDLFDEKPRIKEIHLGGGTPTFFSPENLKKLMDGILAKAEICEEHGFSFVVQDYDPKVQMSSISDSWYAFAQNVKTVDEYTNLVNAGKILVFRGYELSNEDLIIRNHIINIMCHFETSWTDEAMQFPELQECLERLKKMEQDGLVQITETGLSLPEHARPFVRNVCMAFDLQLIRNKPTTRIFSMTI